MTPATAYLRQIMADAGGSISVERFMREALYHPQFGYYAARVRRLGRQGDFSTSATLHPALGTAVARWAFAHRGEVRARGGAWHVIELGGGSGDLAATFLDSLGWLRRRGLTYHLIEISPRLQAAQRERLGRRARRVRWHAEIAAALAQAGGRALIFSNEFVDAFPCVQVVRDPANRQWREVCVHWGDGAGHPLESFAPWPANVESAAIPCSALAAAYSPGQRLELHLSFRRWLGSWRSRWHSGRLLTIDYGDETSSLYHRRPAGTLRAYCGQQRFTGPEIYARFGQQDLTADVNFTDLEAWGDALGLPTASRLTQRAFLGKWLPPGSLRRAPLDPRLAFLLHEEGAGHAFQVLEQIAPPPPARVPA